jgi:hypothetical protein
MIVLTVVNLLILVFNVGQSRSATADGVAPVLRGRALEIVDERGRVRASISVFPADPTVKMPDGTTGYPETVLLRLRDSKGRPNVKMQATELGGGVGLGGEEDPTYATLSATGASTSLELRNKDGRERIIKP